MSVFRAANNVNAGNGTTPGNGASASYPAIAVKTVDHGSARPIDAYPINQGRDETVPDGPTEPIEDRRRRRRDRIIWLAVVVALLALAVSAFAGTASWQAINLARRPQHVTVMPPTPAPAPTGFAVTYAQEPLRVQVGCSAVLFVDLDEPRSNADEKVSDLRYDSNCGKQTPRLTLGPGAAGGAEVRNADYDAEGCERAIRTSPLGPGASAEVRRGTVLCVLTADKPASMALVEVTDVGPSGTAAMRATSWKLAG